MKRISTVLLIAALWLCLVQTSSGQTRLPALPLVYLDSSLPPVTGRTVFVQDLSRLQAAINDAQPGDQIIARPGKIIARLDFKNTPNLPGWITIRSANSDRLPPYGYRVSPADVPNMVTVESPDTLQALDFWPTYSPANVTKAHHIILIGFNVVQSPRYSINFGLVKMGTTAWQTTAEQSPSDIWLDRCVIQGSPSLDSIRGIVLNGVRQSITGCWIGSIHSRNSGDTQAIACWNGAGPFRIVNNYLESAGENVLFGGADPSIQNLVPSDIEFRGNYLAKPLSWNPLHPTYAGTHWGVKNLFELKNARRVFIDGNVMENCWEDVQTGFAVQLTPRNQDNHAPWSTVEDVTLTNNTVRHAAGGLNFLGKDFPNHSGVLSRVYVAGNNLDDIGTPLWGFNGRLFQVLDGTIDLTIAHNTGYASHAFLVFDLAPNVRFTFTDNIVARGDAGLIGSDTSEGNDALNHYAPGATFQRNVILTTLTLSSRYPANNYFAQP